jgi:2-C-methyl-D-erythritol 2,4-cyclodiphosphate synthase
MNRVGMGFDAHPFEEGRALALGGLLWESKRGLAGHSDGDVLLHAICDALLGAAALGSLGEYFSDQDPSGRGRESAAMLAGVMEIVRGGGWSVGNVDATLIGETPRIAPRRAEVCARVAAILAISEDRVSIRGTSTNGLGFPARGEGLAAIAVVLLVKA